MSFVHLHTHSEYSLLDGQGRIKKLVAEAKRLGQPALALTDHGVMHGAVEFFRACKDAEIKPIIGVESYQTVWGRPMGGRDAEFDRENYHLLLLAKDMTGYRNLLKIASNSQLNGFYYRPRIDHDFLAKHAAGVVATTGCLGAEVPQLLLQGKEKEAYERLGWYVDVFGKENFFIELQEHTIEDLRPINKQLAPWAQKFGINLLATNDVHYVRAEDAAPHEVLLCVQTGSTMNDEKRMKLSDQSYFLKSREQMEETFRPYIDLPASAFDNSLRIAEMCAVDLEDKNYHLPDIAIPAGHTYQTYLREITEAGLTRLYGESANNADVQERKERELKIIHQMGFDVYFLIVADLCDFARSRNIWWNVRGSGAGSLVAYCTGITGIDPLKNNLVFERFLNPARVSMPDFDLDYPDDQREEMIRYTMQKYGDSQVAQIATMNRMKARAAIRDVGRAKGIELPKVDRIAKLIPGIPGKPVTIQDVLTEGHEFYNPELVEIVKNEAWAQDLVETSMKLEGVARNSGIHAAAVIVADRDLTHYTPLMRASKGSITAAVTQYEFPILESIGLLKVDFLGLSTLTVMREVSRLIKERHGIEYTLANIPIEGEESVEAFKLLSSGEVSGVFQVEGQGMRRVLTEMKPTSFEHIVATISLYRPGPIEYIPQFIRRLHGEEEVDFKHPKLEPILAETLGICVSGDALVMDARTGRRYRLDEVNDVDGLLIQGVDQQWQPAVGKVTHWIDSGFKPVYKVSLRNGAHIKVTADHRLLAESGWQSLSNLQVGDHIATPRELFGPDKQNIDPGVDWQEIVAIKPAGEEHVYDLTVEGLHSFVANNIIVHNCVYQEQIIQILSQLAGYTPGEADLVRRAVSKKKASDIEKHKKIFVAGCKKNGIPEAAATAIYGDIEFFARYGFNKCLPGDVEVIDAATGQLVKIEDLHQQRAHIAETVTCDTATLRFQPGAVAAVMDNGIKPVYRLRTALGREIEATANHPFYTFDGWRVLGELAPGDQLALPRRLPVEGKVQWQPAQVQELAHLITANEFDELPPGVFELTNSQIGSLLTAILGDWRDREVGQRLGSWEATSPRLARQIQHLLLRLGIVCALIPREQGIRFALVWSDTKERSAVALTSPVHGALATSQVASAPGERANDESDIYWDRIISIEYAGEKRVYDLEIPGTHNFVANDILVHNSHAADYAVITVQTAYLKAHYPVEYMAALLLVERDKTEKVTNFINEARRMGIAVLPPDINHSGLDFEIEIQPADAEVTVQQDAAIAYKFPVPVGSAIRFGMAATKNVGEGPVRAILEARAKDGPFKSLEDFCDRVDLRVVGKRPLECLIKVGAFDRFGKRSQLLAVLDQMVDKSVQVHNDRASGQLSIFNLLGESGAAQVTAIPLPNLEEVKAKEKFTWEKELLGVYANSHPLQQLSVDWRRVATCSCAELDERFDGKGVALAGMITSVRTINTKKGDQMAFVQIEDAQGQCEVVVFPRTYAEVKDKLIADTIYLFKGKAQTREGQTSLLLDTLQTYVDLPNAVEDDASQLQRPLLDALPTLNGMALQDQPLAYTNGHTLLSETIAELDDDSIVDGLLVAPADEIDDQDDDDDENNDEIAIENVTTAVLAGATAADSATKVVAAVDSQPDQSPPAVVDGLPAATNGSHADLQPKPATTASAPTVVGKNGQRATLDDINAQLSAVADDDYAPDQDYYALPPTGKAASNGVSTRNRSSTRAAVPPPEQPHPPQAKPETAMKTLPAAKPTPGVADSTPTVTDEPKAAKRQDEQRPVGHGRHLRIVFRRSGDLDRDKYRLKEIYDLVRDPRGHDRFFIRLEQNGQAHELAFPNDLCNITNRLLQDLQKRFRVEATVDEEKA